MGTPSSSSAGGGAGGASAEFGDGSAPIPAHLLSEQTCEFGRKLSLSDNGAILYHGVFLPTKRDVAIKVVPLPIFESSQQEFIDNLVSQLDKLCNIRDYFCDGGSLRDALWRDGTINEYILKGIAVEVVKGLHCIHEQDIVHRCLKPGNVLFSLPHGSVCISDFGNSKVLADTLGLTWIGSVPYMAPERIIGLAAHTNMDVWSLGVMLYEAMFGCLPVRERGNQSLIEAIADGPPIEYPRDSTASPAFQSFLEKCLVRDPEARAQSWELLEHPWLQIPYASGSEIAAWLRASIDRKGAVADEQSASEHESDSEDDVDDVDDAINSDDFDDFDDIDGVDDAYMSE